MLEFRNKNKMKYTLIGFLIKKIQYSTLNKTLYEKVKDVIY